LRHPCEQLAGISLAGLTFYAVIPDIRYPESILGFLLKAVDRWNTPNAFTQL